VYEFQLAVASSVSTYPLKVRTMFRAYTKQRVKVSAAVILFEDAHVTYSAVNRGHIGFEVLTPVVMKSSILGYNAV
jgi:hypothetical protein